MTMPAAARIAAFLFLLLLFSAVENPVSAQSRLIVSAFHHPSSPPERSGERGPRGPGAVPGALVPASRRASAGAAGRGDDKEGDKAARILHVAAKLPFTLTPVLTDLDDPVFAIPLPEGGFLISTHDLPLARVSADGHSRIPISGMPVNLLRQARHDGMLDLVLDPDYLSNRFVYFSYLAGTLLENSVHIVRARLEGNALIDPVLLLAAGPRRKNLQALGGRLAFAADGTLFASIGDRVSFRDAQNVEFYLGKIVRLGRNGAVLTDNPFAQGRYVTPSEKNALPEIYAYGLRAPRGLAQQPGSGRIWTAGAEPDARDEINILKPGGNYGWPITVYMPHGQPGGARSPQDAKSAADRTLPSAALWAPSIEPTAMVFYEGPLSALKGKLLIAGGRRPVLRMASVVGLTVTRYTDFMLPLQNGIGDMRSGSDGALYILAAGRDGQLLRVDP